MKRLIPAIAIAFGGLFSAAWAATPAPLTTLRAIHALSNAQASRALPVAFEATVTYRRAGETTLFVQDGDSAIYVAAPAEFQMLPGDRVLIKGRAKESFRPIVIADSVTVLRHGDLPKPLPVNFDQLESVQRDCMLVSVRGQVLSADVVHSASRPTTRMQLVVDGGIVDAWVNAIDEKLTPLLLDAQVEAVGVVGATFDGKMQRVGVNLSIPSPANIRILKLAETDPWTLPLTGMDEIFASYRVRDFSHRVRVHGTITYFQPGRAMVLQNGAKSLWVETKREEILHIGQQADVTGTPDVRTGFLTLQDGEIQEGGVDAPLSPRPVKASDLAGSGRIFDLVSVEGVVGMEARENGQDQYVLFADGQVFSAIYRHPFLDGGHIDSLMKQVPVGSRVRVTGICTVEDSDPYDPNIAFNILLRSPDDLVVVANPSLLSVRNLLLVAGLLLLVVIASVAWGATMRSKVRRATASLSASIEAEAALERRTAQLEQKRSRILEDINGSRPLAEIVEAITELASFRLEGAPCWCQIADGARLGKCSPELAAMRIVQSEIPARCGPPLGAIFAAFDPAKKPSPIETEALSRAVELATLAIETRRLYTDLLHRSEFDQLTDISNRFSLEKRLDAQIEEARQNAGIFGLIYIDLDEFKQVNDLYGHHVGDLYLQEVALRMKRQLRPHDLLARLGGDEFAVLLPSVRNRAGVEEIAQRLENSFSVPVTLEGHTIQGTASFGIALYPENGATRDELLSVADAAMYAVKNSMRRAETSPAQQPASEPVSKNRA
jgi:diguanylate cyclase (GGDEF)-like protein